jgi:hypothetical protein
VNVDDYDFDDEVEDDEWNQGAYAPWFFYWFALSTFWE